MGKQLKKSNQQKERTRHRMDAAESIFLIDDEIVPLIGMTGGRSPALSYPNEYKFLESLTVGQSARFKTDKLKIVQSCRLHLKRYHEKAFLIKKIDDEFSRIWRTESKKREKGKRAKYNISAIDKLETNKKRSATIKQLIKEGKWQTGRKGKFGGQKLNNATTTVPTENQITNPQN